MKFLLASALLVLPWLGLSQSVADFVSEEYNKRNYLAVAQKANSLEQENVLALPDSTIFQISFSFFCENQSFKAHSFLDQLISAKRSLDRALYVKALMLFEKKDYTQTITYADKLITEFGEDPEILGLKGESFYSLKQIDKANENYYKALQYEDCPGRVLMQYASLCLYQGKRAEAISTYRRATISEFVDPQYRMFAWVELANFEIADGKLEEVEKNLKGVFELNKTHYPSESCFIAEYLVRLSHQKGDFQQADHFRKHLYECHKQMILPGELSKSFNFDKFNHKKYTVYAYETYRSEKGAFFYKHIYYVYKGENFLYSIQSEHSSALMNSQSMYVMGKTTQDSHYTYFSLSHPENVQYEEMKKDVIRIIDNKVKPTSSSGLKR